MKSLEIFSGAGGLAKGLELAGFSHSAFVEYNKDACASLKLNFKSEKVFHGDIADFDLTRLNNIDLIAGGPPCQPFSLGGKHQAHNDNRDMFPYAINTIEKLQPKAFLFENVKGLLRTSFRDYFDYIILRLTYPNCQINSSESWEQHLERLKKITLSTYNGIAYKVMYKLVNAADYGIPQKRERVLIVGIRSDLGVGWQFPIPTHSEDRLNWDKYVSHTYWKRHNMPIQLNEKIAKSLQKKYGMFPPTKDAWQTIRDCLIGIPHPNDRHDISDHIYKEGAKIYPGHTGSEIDQPSKTIKAGGHGVPGGENMIRYENDYVRYFTVYEAKLIQTFPESYSITGAWGEAMRQIGNAVPVKLAEIMGKKLYKTIRNAEQEQEQELYYYA